VNISLPNDNASNEKAKIGKTLKHSRADDVELHFSMQGKNVVATYYPKVVNKMASESGNANYRFGCQIKAWGERSKNGRRFLLVVTDWFTKYALLYLQKLKNCLEIFRKGSVFEVWLF
jgi:hypothetical protein